MRKITFVIILCIVLLGCRTASTNEVPNKSTNLKRGDGSTIIINSNVDESYNKKIDHLVINILTVDRMSKYNIMLKTKEIDFATEIENSIKSELQNNNITSYIFKSSNLDLKTNSVNVFAASNNAKYYLELHHLYNSIHGEMVISQKYDISLFSLETNNRIWRGQVEIHREILGSWGLTEKSAELFAKELINQLKIDGLIS